MYGGREIVRVLAGVRWAKAQIEEGARKKKSLNCGHRHKRQERKVWRAQSTPFFFNYHGYI